MKLANWKHLYLFANMNDIEDVEKMRYGQETRNNISEES